MFQRELLHNLKLWASKDNRKPLVIRGARQVGKTTLIHEFSQQFEQYIYLNLELPNHKAPFLAFKPVETLAQQIFLLNNKQWSQRSKTLLFIDEIQEVPMALQTLRYFYESYPELPVIVAGSLLERLLHSGVSFPVGRVEYMVLKPASFIEFLHAKGETAMLEVLNQIPLPDFAIPKGEELWKEYALIGGMPEVVQHYCKTNDITALKPIYQSLLQSYLDDVEKYAKDEKQAKLIRFIIEASFEEAGKRIRFHGFGHSSYGSREVSEAFQTLHAAMIIKLIYPHISTSLPLVPDRRKSPRLHLLDTGLLNYMSGIQAQVLGTNNISEIHQGLLVEHLIGQELDALSHMPLDELRFWVREKKTSMAEIDYLILHEGLAIPVEVKSGATGKLRSLHMFMSDAPHRFAVRFYHGPVQISKVDFEGQKLYWLLNLPHFLVSRLPEYVNWLIQNVN